MWKFSKLFDARRRLNWQSWTSGPWLSPWRRALPGPLEASAPRVNSPVYHAHIQSYLSSECVGLEGRGRGGPPEPRGLAAPPARAAPPGELIQVASAPRTSRNPQKALSNKGSRDFDKSWAGESRRISLGGWGVARRLSLAPHFTLSPGVVPASDNLTTLAF
ncbi:unnamed protein product [Colias eurytheme]|nr:unnamed protein product [Colias eurytheme]